MEALHLHPFELRLLVALVFGALIGLERQWQHKMAGIKTNALVALGSAIFIVLSQKILGDSSSESRIAAQIVTGIGFLGGGVIMKEGFTILGINTAATIWCSGAVGCLAGFGYGYEATIATLIVLGANIGLRPLGRTIDQRIGEDRKEDMDFLLTVYYRKEAGSQVRKEVLTLLKNHPNLRMDSFDNHQIPNQDPHISVQLKALRRDDDELNSIVDQLSNLDEITRIRWEPDFL